MWLSRFSPVAHAKDIKVFWLFFSKKNCFLYFDDQICACHGHLGSRMDLF
jgi:hypothetical protein